MKGYKLRRCMFILLLVGVLISTVCSCDIGLAYTDSESVSKETVGIINRLISQLPEYNEIEKNIDLYSNDSNTMSEYISNLTDTVTSATELYNSLPESEKSKVSNAEKLEELSSLYRVETLGGGVEYTNEWNQSVSEAEGTYNVYDTSRSWAIFHGGQTIGDYTEFDFKDWWVFIRDESESSVAKVYEPGESKSGLKVPPIYKGVVVCMTSEEVKKLGYNDNTKEVYDLSVSSNKKEEPDGWHIDVTIRTRVGTIPDEEPKYKTGDKLKAIDSTSTKDLITVNLWDYSSKLNTDFYDKDVKYLGWQNYEEAIYKGTSGNIPSSINVSSGYSFGDKITEDEGRQSIITKNAINEGKGLVSHHINGWVQDSVFKQFNVNPKLPVSLYGYLKNGKFDVMNSKLINGYPQTSDRIGGVSLEYLFSKGVDGVSQVNTSGESIDGLFRYNKSTSYYEFDSRKNMAVYDPATNRFRLYNALLTSDAIMYPFGNFFPLTNLSDTIRCSDIGPSYFYEVQTKAAELREKYDKYSRMWMGYNSLNGTMAKWRQGVDAAYGTNSWSLFDVTKAYTDKTFGVSIDKAEYEGLFTNLYQIDYNAVKDYFFGMDAHLQFLQPKGGKILTDSGNYEDMRFKFSGDDDVWVYIDDNLALDLSGIHQPEGGIIDFNKGQVEYYNWGKQLGYVNVDTDEPQVIVPFTDIFPSSMLNEKGTLKDDTMHSFDFYYLERGCGSGVCQMAFNFPILNYDSLYVGKELKVSDNSNFDGNPDFQFQVLKEGSTGYTTDADLFIKPGTEFEVYDTNMKPTGVWKKVGEHGIFTLKANEYACFERLSQKQYQGYYVRELLNLDIFPGYELVQVDGAAVTEKIPIDIGVERFAGCDSPIKHLSDGITVFTFQNQADSKKFGSLEIAKEVVGNPESNKEFTFLIELDGEPISKGKAYTLKLSDGTYKTMSVGESGKIVLKDGESALFSSIIPGAYYSIKEECPEDKDGHSIKWNIPEANGVVSGIITAEGEGNNVKLVCKNCYSEVQIQKVDEEDNPLAGAELAIYNKESLVDGNIVEGSTPIKIWTSRLDPEVLTGILKEGETYILAELTAPEGYVKSEPMPFVVQELGKTTFVKLTNIQEKPKYGNISISKSVVGTGGDKSKEFRFTARFEREISDVRGIKNGKEVDLSIEVVSPGVSEISFTLSDGDKIVLEGIPLGVVYEIKEESEGYIVTKSNSYGVTDFSESDTIDCSFENRKDMSIPTGTFPLVSCVILVLLGVFGFLFKLYRLKNRVK